MTGVMPARLGLPVRAAAPQGVSAATSAQTDRMDAALLLLLPAIVTNIWYWQLIIPGVSSLKLGILSVVGSLVAFMASRHRMIKFSDPVRRPVQLTLIIGVLAVIGGPFAIVRGTALDFIVYLFSPTVLLAILVAIRARSLYSIRVVIDGIVIGGLLYVFVFMKAPMDAYGKPFGTPFYDANDAAMMALCCLTLTVGRMTLSTRWISRLFFAGVALAYLAMVVRSSSRGAFLALVVTLVVVLLTARTVPVKWRIGTIVGGVLVVLALGSASYWALIGTILEPEKDYNWAGNSESGRIEIWKRGFGYMIEDPVLGSGALNYSNKEGRSEAARQAAAEGRGTKWSVAHNAYVSVGVELGIPGFVCFLAIFITTFRLLWRTARSTVTALPIRRLAEFLIATLVAFCFSSIFISSQYWTFLYVLIALSTSLVAVGRREAASATHGGAGVLERPPVSRFSPGRGRLHPVGLRR